MPDKKKGSAEENGCAEAKKAAVKKKSSSEALRFRADKPLDGSKNFTDDSLRAKYEELSQELDVNRTELEIQKEDLLQTQAELQASHHRYQNLFETAPFGYLVIDGDGSIIQINAAGRRLLGDQRQLKGTLLSRFVDSGSIEIYSDFLKKVTTHPGMSSCEVRMKIASDRTRYIRLQGMNEHADGSPASIVLSMNDITDFREAERAERIARLQVQQSYKALVDFHIETEKQYHSFIENASEGAAITQDGKIQFVNRTLAGLLGSTAEELISMKLDQFVHPEDRTRLRQYYMDRTYGRKVPVDSKMRIIGQDGKVHWVRQNDVNIQWREKPALMHFLTDISVQKKYESELERERQTLKTILDNIPVMIFFHDAKGEINLINHVGEQSLGWSLDEARQLDLLEACFPDEELRRKAWDFMMNAPAEWRDLPIVTKSGESLETSWTNIKLPDGTHIGIGLDVSQRKQHERDILAAKEQLEMERHTLQTILDNIPVMIFFYDDTGQTTFANRTGERLLGRTLEEMRQIDMMEASFPDEKLRKEVLDFMLECPDDWHDHPVTTKFGVSFDSSWYNIKLPDGSHIGIGLDVSQRKEYENGLVAAKEQLESERHTLQSILDNIPVMIYFYDSTGQAIFANRQYERLMGWSLEEMQKINMMEACFPDENLRKKVLDFMIECPPEWRDHPVTTKSGDSFDSSWYNIKLPDGSHIGIGIDNSQRKAYERELIKAKGQLENERSALQNKNITLREVLSQIEAEKDIIKKRMLVNIRRSVLSDLGRLKDLASPSLVKNIEIIEKHLKDIASPFVDEFSDQFRELTARELEICRLIKDGLRTKEMANMLNVSIATIQKHRESIRRKLKITGKGTNLYAYLQSFAEKIDSGKKPRARSSRRRMR